METNWNEKVKSFSQSVFTSGLNGLPALTSLTWGGKVLQLFGKGIFAYWVRLKIKKDTSWVVLIDESLKISQIFGTKSLLYCDLYSLYRKIVHGPGWSKIRVYSYCGDLRSGRASVTKSLHKGALEIHHWAMHVEMRADSVGDHVALFLARKSHLKRNLSVACRGLFWKTKELSPTRLFRLKAPLKANYHLPFEGCQIIRQGH